MDVREEELQDLYIWVDGIPLSRPKKNIARDFSDGVLMAEVVHNFYPRLVELHNYSAANGMAQKLYNWSTLNTRVFKRLGFVVAQHECEAVANCEPGAVERVLKLTRERLARLAGRRDGSAPPSSAGDVCSPSGVPEASEYEQRPASAAGISAHYPGRRSNAEECGSDAQHGQGQPDREDDAHMEPPHPKARLSAGLSRLRLADVNDKRLAAAVSERDRTILALTETNEILEAKVHRLEQLVKLKDAKLHALSLHLQRLEGS